MTREEYKQKSSDARKIKTYANHMFLDPTRVKNPERVINQIVVLSSSSKKRRKKNITHMCVIHMNVGGRTASFTRHVPDYIMSALRSRTRVNIVEKNSHA